MGLITNPNKNPSPIHALLSGANSVGRANAATRNAIEADRTASADACSPLKKK